MQPYFFPYIGYWQLIHAVDTFVIFDDVNYINRGYINRNNILINSKKQYFTLELAGASQNKKINEIEVGHNRSKLLKTLRMAYRKAPYFDTTFQLLEDIITCREQNLARFLGDSLKCLTQYFGLDTKLLYSGEILKDEHLKAQDKIIDIANRLEATRYVNAIGGQELYDKQRFAEGGLELDFLKSEVSEYRQFDHTFTSHLSIIDIMMFNDLPNIQEMLDAYELI